MTCLRSEFSVVRLMWVWLWVYCFPALFRGHVMSCVLHIKSISSVLHAEKQVSNLSIHASRVDIVLLSWWALLLRPLDMVFPNWFFFSWVGLPRDKNATLSLGTFFLAFKGITQSCCAKWPLHGVRNVCVKFLTMKTPLKAVPFVDYSTQIQPAKLALFEFLFQWTETRFMQASQQDCTCHTGAFS